MSNKSGREFCTTISRYIELKRSQSDCVEEFTKYFKTEIRFNRHACVIHLEKKDVNRPLATANPELWYLNEKVILEYLARYERDDIVWRVRKKIIEQLPSGNITRNSVSALLHRSERNLQRKMKEHGFGFRKMLDETRAELTKIYLENKNIQLMKLPVCSVSLNPQTLPGHSGAGRVSHRPSTENDKNQGYNFYFKNDS